MFGFHHMQAYLKKFREALKNHDPEAVALVVGINVLEEGVQVFDVAPTGLGIFRNDVNHDVTGSFLDCLWKSR